MSNYIDGDDETFDFIQTLREQGSIVVRSSNEIENLRKIFFNLQKLGNIMQAEIKLPLERLLMKIERERLRMEEKDEISEVLYLFASIVL